jgi:hypothetical protein
VEVARRRQTEDEVAKWLDRKKLLKTRVEVASAAKVLETDFADRWTCAVVAIDPAHTERHAGVMPTDQFRQKKLEIHRLPRKKFRSDWKRAIVFRIE